MATKSGVPGIATPGLFVPGDPGSTSGFSNAGPTPASRILVVLSDDRVLIA